MDALYILGDGSLADDIELKYSVRSIAQHMRDLRNVFVVGREPRGLAGVRHIEAEDQHKEPWKNMLDKVREGCKDEDLSDDFLLMNDDFFAVRDFVGSGLPFYATAGGTGGLDGKHCFRVHVPIRINKEWFAGMPLTTEEKGGRSPRTFYCNIYNAPPTFVTDCVVRLGDNAASVDEQIAERNFFTISNGTAKRPSFQTWLALRWQEPCRFEQ